MAGIYAAALANHSADHSARCRSVGTQDFVTTGQQSRPRRPLSTIIPLLTGTCAEAASTSWSGTAYAKHSRHCEVDGEIQLLTIHLRRKGSEAMSWMPVLAWYVTPTLLLLAIMALNWRGREFRPAPVRVKRPSAVRAVSCAPSDRW